MQLHVRKNGQRVERVSASLTKAISRLGPIRRQAVMDIGRVAMRDYLERVTERVAKGIKPYSGPRPTKHLNSRSGRGLKSLKEFLVRDRGRDIEGVVALPRHMAQHEFGGEIKARNGKYLTIPLPAALKPDGTPKKMSARAWEGTYVVDGKRGTKVIMQHRPGRDVPIYVLKRKVRISPRLGLRKALRSERTGLRRDVVNQIRGLLKAP